MRPIKWEDADQILLPPPGSRDVDPLPIKTVHGPTSKFVCSCWQLDEMDLKEVLRTGRVYLMVMGSVHPPVLVSADKPYEIMAENDPRLPG